MEKMIAGDFGKMLILLSMGLAGLFALFIRKWVQIKSSFSLHQKSAGLYVLMVLVLFAAIACAGYWHAAFHHLTFFLLYQFCFLLLGIGHVYWLRQYARNVPDTSGREFFLTLILCILGSITFLIVYQQVYPDGLVYDMTGSIIFFAVPWLVDQTFQKAITIPPKIIKQWYYPIGEEPDEPDEKKLKQIIIISFELQKQASDVHFTNFRVKAPVNMEAGELFYYFINDYNERHAEAKIEFMQKNGTPQGWVFYKKHRWYYCTTRYVDADKTISKNKVKENDIIICHRSFH